MLNFKTELNDIIKYNSPKKTLNECRRTIELILNENEKTNPYILLARVFELYKQGAEEEHADCYFYKYLKSISNKNIYTFLIEGKEIKVDIDIFNPFVEVEYDNEKISIIDPKWHLMISYYVYKDATYNHEDHEIASKIKEMRDKPSKKFGFKCKSLKMWMQEAFEEIE